MIKMKNMGRIIVSVFRHILQSSRMSMHAKMFLWENTPLPIFSLVLSFTTKDNFIVKGVSLVVLKETADSSDADWL